MTVARPSGLRLSAAFQRGNWTFRGLILDRMTLSDSHQRLREVAILKRLSLDPFEKFNDSAVVSQRCWHLTVVATDRKNYLPCSSFFSPALEASWIGLTTNLFSLPIFRVFRLPFLLSEGRLPSCEGAGCPACASSACCSCPWRSFGGDRTLKSPPWVSAAFEGNSEFCIAPGLVEPSSCT